MFETATLTEWCSGKGGIGGSGLKLEEGWRGVSERGGGAEETISILSVTSWPTLDPASPKLQQLQWVFRLAQYWSSQIQKIFLVSSFVDLSQVLFADNSKWRLWRWKGRVDGRSIILVIYSICGGWAPILNSNTRAAKWKCLPLKITFQQPNLPQCQSFEGLSMYVYLGQYLAYTGSPKGNVGGNLRCRGQLELQ